MAKKSKTSSVWKNYFSMLFKSKLPWAFVLTCFLMSLLESQMKLWLTSEIAVITGAFENAGDALTPLSIGLFLGLGTVVIGVANKYLQGLLGAKIDRNIQNYSVEKVFYLKVKDLDERDPREFISRLTDDTAKNTTFCVNLFVNEIPRIYFLVSYIIRIAGYHQPSLMISSLAMIPIIFGLALITGRVYFINRNNIQAKIAVVTAKLAEKIDNIEIIKNYNNEEKEIESGLKVIDELDKVKREGAWAEKFNKFILLVSFGIPFILMVVPPAILKFRGEFDSGTFLAYLMTVAYWRTYLEEHITLWTDMKEAQGATFRLSGLLEMENEMSVGGSTVPESGDIEFHNVSFSYGENKVLDDVSFTICKGQKTAIVGLSGSGKSTVLNLIEKFYVPSSGTITMNGTDINSLDYAGYGDCFPTCLRMLPHSPALSAT